MFVHIRVIEPRKLGARLASEISRGEGSLLTIHVGGRMRFSGFFESLRMSTFSAFASLRMIKAGLVLLLVISAICPICAAEEEEQFVPLALLKEKEPNGPAIAAALTETFLTQEQFKNEVEKIRSKFEDWEKDTQGDMGRYLNDRLILVALGAANGKVDRIQRGILWLAFYKEFEQASPQIVAKFLREHSGSLNRLFTDFTWEKASQYIKNKEWRKDIEERKKAAEAQIAPAQPMTAAIATSSSDGND